MFIQQTHFLGWPDIRMFRIQRCFTWLTIDETYGWVHLCICVKRKTWRKVPCLRARARARLEPRTSRSGIRSVICLATHSSKASHEDIHCSIVKSFLTKTLLGGSRSKFSKTLGMTQSCRGYFYIYFFYSGDF